MRLSKLLKNSALELARLLMLVIGVLLMTFMLLSISPIDPLLYYMGDSLLSVSSAHAAEMATQLGLDESMWRRFLHWFTRLMQGDAGYSISQQQPVVDVFAQRVPLSLRLMVMGWLGAVILGYGLGIVAAFYQSRFFDRMIQMLCWVSASAPAFWIAILALSLFSVSWQITPVCCAAPLGVSPASLSWFQQLPYLILPAGVLAITNMSHIAIHTRERALQVLGSDHVAYARMHGKQGWYIYRHHILRNTLTPALVLHFAGVAELLGGSVLVESVFNFPGIGQSLVMAGLNGDLALLMAITLLSLMLVFIGNGLGRLTSLSLLPEGRNHV
ncbi:ABC transporter permease [Thaumasiovibrio sp. DFM-14]|uniref:ABC transporter permease n=1 Tax=Thaumasiovibrio sp. DFM-14 TaxID=3384792 RepID=UPI0039A2234F